MPTQLSTRGLAAAIRVVYATALVSMWVCAARPSEANEESADPIFVTFDYRAPATCMGEEQAFSLLHRRSRRVHRVEDARAQQRLGVTIVADTSGYRGVLTVTRAGQAPERRSMTGGSCDEVVEALALTAALSIDPEATVTLGPAAPSNPKGDGVVPAREIENEDGGTSTSEDEESVTDVSGARLDVNLGLTSAVTRLMDHTLHFGGGVQLAVSRRSAAMWFPLEARVSVYGLTETVAAHEPAVVTSFFGSRWAYCPVRVGADPSLLLCPVAQVGALTAESRGFDGSTRATRWLATVGVEAWSRARISRRVDLWLSPALEVPLTKRRFAVDPGPEILASTSAVVWGVSAGIGWSF